MSKQITHTGLAPKYDCLKNMRVRATDIRAALNIHSKINEGTRVRVVVTI